MQIFNALQLARLWHDCRLSVCNGCIVAKRLGRRKKTFARIFSLVSWLSAYKISGMQFKGNIFKFGVKWKGK